MTDRENTYATRAEAEAYFASRNDTPIPARYVNHYAVAAVFAYEWNICGGEGVDMPTFFHDHCEADRIPAKDRNAIWEIVKATV